MDLRLNSRCESRPVNHMSTISAKAADVQHDWYVVDAKDLVLGRLATRVATVLRGKHKVIFTPHVDTGDFVVVINAADVMLTGNKLNAKQYHDYTGYFGGLNSKSAREVLATNPERVIRDAVKGMLPKNKLGRQIIKKLKIYPGAEHPHAAQKPQSFPDYV